MRGSAKEHANLTATVVRGEAARVESPESPMLYPAMRRLRQRPTLAGAAEQLQE